MSRDSTTLMSGVITVLLIALFLLSVFVPEGLPVSVLYIVPLTLMSLLRRKQVIQAAGARPDPRSTAVAFGHLVYDGEAGAGSLDVSAYRPLKQHDNPFGLPSRNPGTSVLHHDWRTEFVMIFACPTHHNS